MTTTITLETHGWPCLVETTNNAVNPDGLGIITVSRERVDRYQRRSIIIYGGCSVAFQELTAEGWQDNPANLPVEAIDPADQVAVPSELDASDGA